MDTNLREYNGQSDINDLIVDAVDNAIARRNLAGNLEDAFSMSDEETIILGGMLSISDLKLTFALNLLWLNLLIRNCSSPVDMFFLIHLEKVHSLL